MSVIINGNGTITNDAGAGIDFGSENISTTGVVTGVASGLTAIPAANLTGTLPASSGANLTALNATNLGSGTVPDARFPATLPASSGVNLTALNASNLGSGTVPSGRLGSGTASSSTFLRGDGSWQAAGGGAWTKIATVVADNDATLTITGIAVASFECYALVLSRFQPVNDQADLFIRIGAGGTPATSGYNNQNVYNGTANTGDTGAIELTNSVRSSTDGTGVGIAWIHPFLTDSVTAIHGQFYSPASANVQSIFGGALPASGDSIDRIQILFDSGNMKYGRATLYGIDGHVA
jgi:hypothetical protein